MTSSWYRLVFAQVLLQACMAGLRLAIPLYLLKLQSSPGEVGATLALFFTAGLVLSLRFAAFMDRWGMQAAWRMAVGLAVMGSAVCALWPNGWGMACAAFVSGASASLSQMVTQKHVARSFAQPVQRNSAFGWMMLALSAGNLVGPVCVGMILDHAGPSPTDRQSLVAACIFTGTLALASAWFTASLRAGPSGKDAAPPMRAHLAALWRDPPTLRVLACSALVSACWDGFVVFAPILGHAQGLSASAIGIILGAFAVAAAAIRPFVGRVPPHIPGPRIVACGLVITAVVCAVYPFITSMAGLVTCAAILGVALGVAQPLLLTALVFLAPTHLHGQALGLRLTLTSASHVAIPVLFGALGTLTGLAPVFALTALMAGGSACLAWYTPVRR